MAESFFANVECELIDRSRFRHEAALAVIDYIEGFYNTRRRHSALDYQSRLPEPDQLRRSLPPTSGLTPTVNCLRNGSTLLLRPRIPLATQGPHGRAKLRVLTRPCGSSRSPVPTCALPAVRTPPVGGFCLKCRPVLRTERQGGSQYPYDCVFRLG